MGQHGSRVKPLALLGCPREVGSPSVEGGWRRVRVRLNCRRLLWLLPGCAQLLVILDCGVEKWEEILRPSVLLAPVFGNRANKVGVLGVCEATALRKGGTNRRVSWLP